MITKLVSFLKRFLFNEKLSLLNELLFIRFFSLLGPEIEEFLSILIIKQYFNMNVFVLAPRLDGSLSWINKYDNKTTSRWQQVPVLINDLLNHSNQTIHSKRLIQ